MEENTKICPICSAAVDINAEICPTCGADLKDIAANPVAMGESIANTLDETVSKVQDTAGEVYQDAKASVENTVEDVKDAAADVKDEVGDVFSEANNDVRDAVADFNKQVEEGAEAVGEKIEEGQDKLRTAFEEDNLPDPFATSAESAPEPIQKANTASAIPAYVPKPQEPQRFTEPLKDPSAVDAAGQSTQQPTEQKSDKKWLWIILAVVIIGFLCLCGFAAMLALLGSV